MTETAEQSAERVEIVEYDPRWAEIYAAERKHLCAAIGDAFIEFEHIGSTAVPGMAAKPIIDMMVAVDSLAEAEALLPTLADLDYHIVETGMRNRLFLRKRRAGDGQQFHLHIVEAATWDDRKERHLRDYLTGNPGEARAYGELKARLAEEFRQDPLAYTKAKTAFIQRAIDTIRDAKGLPRIDVWED
jgi:GrpB-like predicted nucleotidyltransferase (UPF0157 family)